MPNNFEVALSKCFNRYFAKDSVKALAYRFEKSSRFSFQPCDVLIDSREKKWYCAIEAKSRQLNKGKSSLYFSSFSDAGDTPQMERLHNFCGITGRKGYLAVELWDKKTKGREAYLLELKKVYPLWLKGDAGIPFEVIRKGKPLKWEGKYSKGRYIYMV